MYKILIKYYMTSIINSIYYIPKQKRKPKVCVPERKKDEHYHAYRKINTLRAYYCRRKKREADIRENFQIKKRIVELNELNDDLRDEIIHLNKELEQLIILYKEKITYNNIFTSDFNLDIDWNYIFGYDVSLDSK